MFAYLSKKIQIPNKVRLRCVSWNPESNHIACGGEDGLLKVLKLESATPKDGEALCTLAAPTQLTMNQTLSGHSAAVQSVVWNAQHTKLTSVDASGMIIVWMLHKGSFVEEMVNHRDNATVASLCWSHQGDKIAIVYDDGLVIVGSVDGNRLWGKSILASNIACKHAVNWSTDGSRILVGTSTQQKSELVYVDASTGQIAQVSTLHALADVAPDPFVSLLTYRDHTICCFARGRIQVTPPGCAVDDGTSGNIVVIDTRMTNTSCHVVHDMLVAGGTLRDSSVIQFYSLAGKHLFTMKVPGTDLGLVTGDASGLRLALTVESYLYFAHVRPAYMWGFVQPHSLVYAFRKTLPLQQLTAAVAKDAPAKDWRDNKETALMFWNAKTQERHIKYVKQLRALATHGEHVLLCAQSDDEENICVLCNSIGAPLDSRRVSYSPTLAALSSRLMVIASNAELIVFSRTFSKDPKDDADANLVMRMEDPIAALSVVDDSVFVVTEGGMLYHYVFTAPVTNSSNTSPLHKIALRLPSRATHVAANCDATKVLVLDQSGSLILLKVVDSGFARVDSFERKDVWQCIWASDHADRFAVLEKARLTVFCNTDAEEPLESSAHVGSFERLKIKSISLDDAVRLCGTPELPPKDAYFVLETKALRDTRALVSHPGVALTDALSFVSAHPHPRLWKLLAEQALQRGDFSMAERAFVAYKDYTGLALVKRLRKMPETLQKAETAVYFGRFDEADALFKKADRADLAVNLRRQLGDYVSVLAEQPGDSEALIGLGDYYYDRFQFAKAAPYYEQAGLHSAAARCYDRLDRYDDLQRLIDVLPPGDRALALIGRRLGAVGLVKRGVDALVKAGEIDAAVDACVGAHEWERALQIARDVAAVEALLQKVALALASAGRIDQAVELYRRASRWEDAARVLQRAARNVLGQQGTSNLPLAKRLFVLAAQDAEQWKKNVALEALMAGGDSRSTKPANTKDVGQSKSVKPGAFALAALGLDDSADAIESEAASSMSSKEKDQDREQLVGIWRGAEATHFFLLATRQLYDRQTDRAARTALLLTAYEDILPARDVWSLVALCAYHAQWYNTAARAFMRLEHLTKTSSSNPGSSGLSATKPTGVSVLSSAPSPSSSQPRKGAAGIPGLEMSSVEACAVNIFSRHAPTDPPAAETEKRLVQQWMGIDETGTVLDRPSVCVASGRLVSGSQQSQVVMWRCRVCRHTAIETEMAGKVACPLCHSAISITGSSVSVGSARGTRESLF